MDKCISKILFPLTLCLWLLSGTASAQTQTRFEKIHAVKVGFITDKLQLTSAQSAKFWPVYNRYEDERHALRRSFKEKSKEKFVDDAAACRYVDNDLDYQQQEIDLKRKYKVELQKVLSSKQLADLYRTEREFKEMLLQRLNDNPSAMKH